MLLFLIFMLKGFVEHILVEFCHHWDLDNMNITMNAPSEDIKGLYCSILTMTRSTGIDTSHVSDSMNISELLSIFRVGTEKMKVFNKQSLPEELIPLQFMDISSNNKKIKQMMKTTAASASASASTSKE
jgi:hypothetical protein